MRFLITGGCGFIGSHLADLLLARGDTVTVLDDLTTGNLANVARHEGDPRFRVVIGSVLEAELVRQQVASADRVFHLASAVGVKLVCERPRASIETIVHGTENVLMAAADRDTPVLVTSSSEVYGKSRKVPFTESDDIVIGPPTAARWSYALAKAVDEQLALAHWHEHQTPAVVTRLFNTVGPRQTGRYGMVLPRFVRAALRGEDLVIHGDGSQTRCFVHVEDVADALPRLIECPGARGEVVNV